MAIRVNKVTASIEDEYSPGIVTLYRTNTKLAEITNDQLGVPDMFDAKVDKPTYLQYLKDLTIHLLEQGGIEGFYWEPKKVEQSPDGGQVVRKFTASQFREEAIKRLSAQMDAMVEDTNVTYKISQYKEDGVNVTDRYKDGKVKYGSTIITATVGVDKPIEIQIVAEIRSGQICKPKTFTTSDGQKHQLNITTLNKLTRS